MSPSLQDVLPMGIEPLKQAVSVSDDPQQAQSLQAQQTQPTPLVRYQSSQDTLEYPLPPVRVGRKFKACRTCRKHKLKCERSSNSACQRCLDNGTQCIFDAVSSRRRETTTKRDDAFPNGTTTSENREPLTPSHAASRSNPRATTSSSADLQPPAAANVQAYNGLPTTSMAGTSMRESPGERSAIYQLTPTTQHSELTSKDLRAPVSAMHNMSHPGDSTRDLSKTPTDTYYSFEQQKPAPRLGLFFGQNVRHDDIIVRGLIDQKHARQLFNSFMMNTTNFLPIFDPILDSFEMLRTREPFCFAVILFLASCVEGSPSSFACVQDVKDLMAGSLFHYPASLGKVQAMILLVAYAESTWYALGHALQMALDLSLDKTLSHEQMPDQMTHFSHSENQRQVIRRARVWLALCFIEREIAMGMAKTSRTPQVSSRDLAHLTCQSHVHPPNMRLASLVEAVQIRDEFLRAITLATDLDSSGLQRMQSINTRFDEWFQHWDALHKDCGYDSSSFQRTSLQGQRSYAIMFLGCATIGRVTGNQPLSTAMSSNAVLMEVVKYVLSIAMGQLRRVVQSESYKWHLRWATNYTIMSLAFAEMCKHQDETDKQEVSVLVMAVAEILTDYHDPFFHRLIHTRLAQHSGTSPVESGIQEHDQDGTVDLDENRAAAGPQALDVMRDDMMAGYTAMDLEGPNISGTLDQFLETADWMTNPSSVMVFDVGRWQNNEGIVERNENG
ncbi:hypothetical protein CEP51_015074 [Fusarium floridanum]|uniref:Zn(2)-C6 fungal-type domain-containing protein n=1 Tax=Fusarium floridanum TaxID=1325733 RepID=A0A428PH37_9HYPO|nr:hypothetical protein CEP51_015074 [Fusarium floridanum]